MTETRSTFMAVTSPPKALVFDVFGTVVDWRTSITREVDDLAGRQGLRVDAAKFADAWRAGYMPSMNRVRTGELPWTKLDDLHRMTLEQVLLDFGMTDLSEEEKGFLNRAWHRLDPWPDAVSGLTRLKRRFIVAPLSNGNIALITNMAKHAACRGIACSVRSSCGTTSPTPKSTDLPQPFSICRLAMS